MQNASAVLVFAIIAVFSLASLIIAAVRYRKLSRNATAKSLKIK